MTKQKILVLASTFPTFLMDDATPPFVFELSKRLVNRFDVYVLAPYSFGTKTHQEEENVIIHRFKYWFGKKNLADGAILPNLKKNKLLYFQIPFFLIFQLLAIIRLHKKYKIDTIHAHWIIPQGLVAVFFKKISNWKGNIICTTHGGDIFGLQFLNKLKKWVINRCTSITVVSEAIKQEIVKLNINDIPVEVIPMGVDVALFNAGAKNIALKEKYNIKGPLLLFVGRLSEKKGVEYLLKAMPRVINHSPNTKLLIVGHGELDQELKDLANKQLNVLDEVIFTGGISNSNLPKYYASADIFIGPSIIAEDGDREGFPVSFMEAMACNTPLIISDLEIFAPFINKKNALKAKEKSSIELSNCIIELIENPDLQQTIVQNNAKLIENTFSLDVIGNRYIKVLIKDKLQ